MPTRDFIDVRLWIDGHANPALELPDEDAPDTVNTMTRYIEVEAGQKWSVRVRVLENFKLCHAPLLFASITVDGNEYFSIDHRSAQGLKHTKGYLQQVVEVAHFEDDLNWNDAKGEWACFQYSFGALGFTEDNSLSKDLDVYDVHGIGTIRVRFYRAKNVRRAEPFILPTKQPKALDKMPEKFLKGSEIKANTKFINPRPVTAPKPSVWEQVPIRGKHGKIYEFVYKYRTRKGLQNLGILERSPSPPPDPVLQAQRFSVMLDETMVANKKLQSSNRLLLAQLTELTMRTNSSALTPASTSTSEQADDEFPEEVAAPTPQPRVVIDLTEDD